MAIRIRRLWGQIPRSIYAVGYGGKIFHFDGVSWQNIASGTTLAIQDVWGAPDATTGRLEVVCVASNEFTFPAGKGVLRLNGLLVQALSDSGLPFILSSVWCTPEIGYVIGGDGLYFARSISSNTVWTGGNLVTGQGYIFSIRGDGANNIFAVGGYGEVIHYNGASWKSLRDQTSLPGGNYVGVAVKGDLVIAVGQNPDRAAVAIGRRIR
jgi:hypothetical protein